MQEELEKIAKAALSDILLANQSFTLKLLANMEDVNKKPSSHTIQVNNLKSKVSAS